ncbi:MAG: hypothetical protein KDB53_12495, partial [Planctomycetes bacterium]|nr:hypothetical protein [Planctomycetota bacterium]
KLRKIEGLDLSFERAFGRSGEAITPRRIGRALAAFVATLEVPAIPASRDESVARGRALFEGKGACQRCHSGKNFSDGLMHTVFVPGSRRDRAQSDRRQRLGALSVGRAADLGFRIPESGLGRAILAGLAPPEPSPFNCDTPQAMRAGRTRSGYGGTTPGVTPLVHNLPLIDVGNTGPWFRDGSAKTLEECVQTHVTELQEVAAQSARIRRELKGDLQDELLPLAMLRAPWERVGASASARPSPRSLSENEIWDLVSYLESLSTQTTVKGSASRSETTTSTL